MPHPDRTLEAMYEELKELALAGDVEGFNTLLVITADFMEEVGDPDHVYARAWQVVGLNVSYTWVWFQFPPGVLDRDACVRYNYARNNSDILFCGEGSLSPLTDGVRLCWKSNNVWKFETKIDARDLFKTVGREAGRGGGPAGCARPGSR